MDRPTWKPTRTDKISRNPDDLDVPNYPPLTLEHGLDIYSLRLAHRTTGPYVVTLRREWTWSSRLAWAWDNIVLETSHLHFDDAYEQFCRLRDKPEAWLLLEAL